MKWDEDSIVAIASTDRDDEADVEIPDEEEDRLTTMTTTSRAITMLTKNRSDRSFKQQTITASSILSKRRGFSLKRGGI